MKAKLLILAMLLSAPAIFGQNSMEPYKDKVFIFDGYSQAQRCDELGGTTGGQSVLMLKGSRFTVENVVTKAAGNNAATDGDTFLIIKFLKWKSNDKITMYNKSTATADGIQYFFLIPLTEFAAKCSEYHYDPRWDIAFGTVTNPFKFRKGPAQFTQNLNLGAAVAYVRKFQYDFSVGVMGGLSLSSVTLDKYSTRDFVQENTERPAFTPSAHIVLGYKKVNLLLGVGWDIINKTTDVEKSWVYNGKPWLGIGLGISLFNSTEEKSETKPDENQSSAK